MSNELIRKSDVIEIMENLVYDMSEVSTIPQLAKSEIEKLEPINAVELPCKVGDTVYFINNNGIKEYLVCGFNVGMRSKSDSSLMIVLKCTYPYINLLADMIGKLVFLTREEAEKALEDLKNDKRKQT